MRDRINTALKLAMKDQEKLRVSTLRLVLAAIKEKEIVQRADDDAEPMDGPAIIEILAKMVKQREESARVYDEGERPELAKQERDEIKIIREFMPKPLSDEEVSEAVTVAIREQGASSIKDMGKVMGALKAQYQGRMDFGAAGAAVRAALN